MNEINTTRIRSHRQKRRTGILVCLALTVGVLAIEFGPDGASADVTGLPAGFTDTVVFPNLDNPTVVQFSNDGRVWVGEKSGIIKVFPSLASQTPTVFADLRTAVHNWWDRGLLGLVLDPQFPTRPYVYVQYSYDKQPGVGTYPRWGEPGATVDYCSDPGGGTNYGCVVQGRVSRLTVSNNGTGNTIVPGSEKVLVEDWCVQFPSHSIGTIAFGPDGYLYAAGGDGASFTLVDYGQRGGGNGVPVNACLDEGGGTKSGEGGALRSQNVRTPAAANGASSLDGAVIRIDPDTGDAAPGNPLSGRANANERRVIAYGLRNPFRLAFRPNLDGSLTDELWMGDVGWNDTEEIDRFSVGAATNPNFGWPCYEGNDVNWGYGGAGLSLCNTLYDQGAGAVTAPYLSYGHTRDIVAGDGCTTGDGGSSITGVAFYTGTSYPAAYRGGLFFTDYNRKCMWVIKKGANGLPDPNQISVFARLGAHDGNEEQSDGGAVDVVPGPNGDLFWVDLFGGALHRITYGSGNQAPTARITANPTAGVAPLAVQFDGTTSSDPEATALSYAWDLDGNGSFETNGATPTYTYTNPTNTTVTLRVTDSGAPPLSATKTIVISPGNSAPTPTILGPDAGTTWRVGDQFNFSGSATDPQGGNIRLDWKVRLLTCIAVDDCVPRQVVTFDDTATGSYTAPDWGGAGNNVLEFRLTATDSGGLSTTVTRRLNPQMAQLRIVASTGDARTIALDSGSVITPAALSYIVGSVHSVSVADTQAGFLGWADGSPNNHEITVPPEGLELVARFEGPPPPPPAPPAPPAAVNPFLALPYATQIAILNYIAAIQWARFVEFCKAVLRIQAAERARARARSRSRR